MKQAEFDKIVTRAIKHIETTLRHKNKEYADEDNVFRNFDNGARKKGITPAQALDGMMLKHIVSYEDMLNGDLQPTTELIEQKLGNILCYFILQWGILERDKKKGTRFVPPHSTREMEQAKQKPGCKNIYEATFLDFLPPGGTGSNISMVTIEEEKPDSFRPTCEFRYAPCRPTLRLEQLWVSETGKKREWRPITRPSRNDLNAH
jgi:hypothetical protein